MVMGAIYGVFRLIGAIGLLRNRMWGLALSVINCVITIALMMFLLPFLSIVINKISLSFIFSFVQEHFKLFLHILKYIVYWYILHLMSLFYFLLILLNLIA